jgi:hypothetical protein
MPKPYTRRNQKPTPQVDRLKALHERLDRALRDRQQMRAEIDRWAPVIVEGAEQRSA